MEDNRGNPQMTHPEYPYLRKLFLQWMFTERLVLFTEAEEFFKNITSSIDFGDDLDNEKDINMFIDYCKKSLNNINLSLKKQLFVLHDRKVEYIGIYNTKSDKIAQTATKLSAENFVSFKKIIDLAKRSSNHELKLTEIEQDLTVPKAQIQSLLNELVENEWLIFNRSTGTGTYCLGPRTLLELSDYLRDPNNEKNHRYLECSICSSFISCGTSVCCPIESCAAAYHHLCIDDYYRATEIYQCPKCKTLLN